MASPPWYYLITASEDIVFAAEELRYAAQAVGKISGLIDVEDVDDVGLQGVTVLWVPRQP